MNAPTHFERDLGKTFRSRFGSETKVVRFGDDGGANDVFIVSGQNCPIPGVTSYASVGLSRNTQPAALKDVKVEIVAACATATPYIDNLVSSCVFDSVKNDSTIVYGACIPNIIVQYGISTTLKHVTFVAPFPWRDLNRVEVEDETVYCLLMLPISDAERRYLIECGIDALEKLFNEKQIDIYDIKRPSAVT
jgi:antitoxin YqcF